MLCKNCEKPLSEKRQRQRAIYCDPGCRGQAIAARKKSAWLSGKRKRGVEKREARLAEWRLMELHCHRCEKRIPEERLEASSYQPKYCSKECGIRAAAQRARLRYENKTEEKRIRPFFLKSLVETNGTSRGSVGATAELIAAADLLLKGFSVYRSVSPNAPCDLVIIGAKQTAIRVEVRTVNGVRATGTPKFSLNREFGKTDLYAAVLGPGEVEYFDEVVSNQE